VQSFQSNRIDRLPSRLLVSSPRLVSSTRSSHLASRRHLAAPLPRGRERVGDSRPARPPPHPRPASVPSRRVSSRLVASRHLWMDGWGGRWW
jgi:hypothetical protein